MRNPLLQAGIGISFALAATPGLADCTEEQKARMIANDVSQETIDKICGDGGKEEEKTKKKSSDGSNVNITIENKSESTSNPTTTATASPSQGKFAKVDNSDGDDSFKHNTLGGGYYQLIQSYEVSWTEYGDYYTTYTETNTNTYTGLSAFYQRALNRYFAVSGWLYDLSGTENSDATVSGYDAFAWLGGNFGYPGWNLAGGLGIYSENWEDESYSSVTMGAKLSYKWKDWSIRYVAALRSTMPQENQLRDGGYSVESYSHMTSSLGLGYRF